ncbi:MAG: hypothetical protein M1834_008410 [Cirrosporium novae-zelandiae]|nr:MAG: hypothetical protein M1834_008410 [Cirrosporium novae-zelandiae]
MSENTKNFVKAMPLSQLEERLISHIETQNEEIKSLSIRLQANNTQIRNLQQKVDAQKECVTIVRGAPKQETFEVTASHFIYLIELRVRTFLFSQLSLRENIMAELIVEIQPPQEQLHDLEIAFRARSKEIVGLRKALGMKEALGAKEVKETFEMEAFEVKKALKGDPSSPGEFETVEDPQKWEIV